MLPHALVQSVGLAWFFLTGHPDAARLKFWADSAHIPQEIGWAVAKVESGNSGNNRAVSYAGAYGRLQLKLFWNKSFVQQCGSKPLQVDYDTNVCKGMFLLKNCRDKHTSWSHALSCYYMYAYDEKHPAPDAVAYRKLVAEVLGTYYLTSLSLTLEG